MTTSDTLQLVVFCLDEQRYALRLETVERSVRAVEVTPLPNAPDIVLGVIDVAGQVLPVVNLRRRFGLPERAISPTDQLLMARTALRTVALLVDEVQEVMAYPAQAVVTASQIVQGLEYIQGVVALEHGLVLIHDLEQCLSLEEERELAHALTLDVSHGA